MKEEGLMLGNSPDLGTPVHFVANFRADGQLVRAGMVGTVLARTAGKDVFAVRLPNGDVLYRVPRKAID